MSKNIWSASFSGRLTATSNMKDSLRVLDYEGGARRARGVRSMCSRMLCHCAAVEPSRSQPAASSNRSNSLGGFNR